MGNELNVPNRTLYHGDNLDFLRALNNESVHLIATDPPFKKNRDFHATPDSLADGAGFKDRWNWDSDVHPSWVDQIKDDKVAAHSVIETAKQSYGEDMAAYLCWLGVRLMEMHRILRTDGSLYLHIDHTAHAYVKTLLDAIFGRKNFRNEIVWGYEKPRSSKKVWRRNHDILLFYTKREKYTFNPQRMPTLDGRFEMRKPFKRPDGSVWHPKEPGKQAGDWWYDIPSFATRMTAKERTGYPTQKPLALYERIIKASSNEGDIVLDPFCGCATTPVASERLERRWVGADIWDKAHDMVLKRLERNGLAAPTLEEKRLQMALITFGEINYTTEVPERTDEKDEAVPRLDLKRKRIKPAWEKLSHGDMRYLLTEAQGKRGKVVCGGCGRKLEKEFMHLDHIRPKAEGGENHIANRILLCGPCNSYKGVDKTLTGLLKRNKKEKWMADESAAKEAQKKVKEKAEWARTNEKKLKAKLNKNTPTL